MGFIYAVLIIFEALLSALLIIIIFMQKTKGGMGGSAFGGGAGEAIFGSRMGNILTKATVVLGTIFLLNTVVLTIMTARRGGHGGSIMDQVETTIPIPVQQPMMPAHRPGQGLPPAPPAGFGGEEAPVQIPMPSMPAMTAPIPEAVPAAEAQVVPAAENENE